MSLFSLGKSAARYGVVIDIGSGSVLVAIVHSDPSKSHPSIVWSHREHAPLRNIDSIEKSAKAVMTALVNASILLDSEGRKVLFDYDPEAKLKEVQCSISAPWSYTVTKTINYDQEESFEITNDLIEELTQTIEEKMTEELKQNETLGDLGLQIITKSKMNLTANGYRIREPEGNTTNTLTISQANVVAQQYLIDAIAELKDKLFTAAICKNISFILTLYTITTDILKQSHDFCLVDITYEATEIGIVRNGILTYCTHTSFGSFSLAREIAEITGVPLHEAFSYLHTEKPYAFVENLNKQQSEDIEKMFESYIEKVTALFHETGDSLSIPKTVSLHSDLKSEPLFINLIKKAAKRSIKTEPYITPISKEIIQHFYTQQTEDSPVSIPTDTALLLSSQFFHTQSKHRSFDYF